MFSSMFIGLSGMQAYSNGLRQVSNNITNLNSTGFKSSDLVFSDLFGAGAKGLGSGNNQSGQGVALTDLRLDFGQGELRQTDSDLAMAVDGRGFLVLEEGGEYTYARTGQFEVDSDGFIVLSGTNKRLTVLGTGGNPTSVNIEPYRTSPPEATTAIAFADNLSSTATEHNLADVAVYNAVGEAANWQVKFTREATDPAGEWTVSVTDGLGEEVGAQALKFQNGIIDPTTAELTFDDGKGRVVTFDFSENVTSYSSGSISTMRAADVDGHGIGDIATLLVNEDGVLEVTYSNEETVELGGVAIADFEDPQQLEQRSGGLFAYNGISGRDLFTSESDRVGRVLSNRVEASNVDLSQQFGDLILVQRGYQASSQVVSISNEMIQQLFGLRGQG